MLLPILVDVNFFHLQIVPAGHIDRLACDGRFNLSAAGSVPIPDSRFHWPVGNPRSL